MIKEPNMLVDQPHSLGAVLKGAILLIFFVFGVEVYAQSYNSQVSYRVGSTTQSTPSAQQGGYGVMGNSSQAFDNGYRVTSGISTQAGEYKKYQGAVYEPFNNTPPSESGESAGVTSRKNAFINPADPDEENRAEGSPIGEPFVLLLFAAVAAIFVAKRKKEPTPVLPQGKE
jgi:hypothetical protein